MKFRKKGLLFCIGGTGYVGLELLWRGYSHGSMFLAGGLCFLLLGALNRAEPRIPRWLRPGVGAMIITMVELAAGLLVNRQYTVWDYRDRWGNFCGQICLLFSLLWIPIAALAMAAYEWLEPSVDSLLEKKPAKNRHG